MLAFALVYVVVLQLKKQMRKQRIAALDKRKEDELRRREDARKEFEAKVKEEEER